MKFSEITAAVNDLWTFCWPPVVACALFYELCIYFVPGQVQLAQSKTLMFLTMAGKSLEARHDALEPFGLNKLVPFLTLFLVIAVLFLVNRIVVLCGRLPPHLSFRPDIFLWSVLSLKQKLLLFRRYPTAETFNNAYYMGLREVPAQALRSELTMYLKVDMFVKFCLAMAVALAIYARVVHLPLGGVLARLLGVSCMAAAIWVIATIGRLYAQQQQFWDDWAKVDQSLQTDVRVLLDGPLSMAESRLLAAQEGGRWWTISLMNTYWLRWFGATFLYRGYPTKIIDPEDLRRNWNSVPDKPVADHGADTDPFTID
jgi:hypothetical protein